MLQDTATTEYKHRLFIDRIVDLDTVWALSSDEGLATSGSSDYEDTDVIPFWSDRAYAAALAKKDWAHYRATSMPLGEFLENWLVGMHMDGLIVGTNWDANMFGKEIAPLDLALEIAEKLVAKGKSPALKKYQDVAEFEAEVRKALNA